MIAARGLKLWRNERGAAVLELALVAPMLALMTIGVVDMSNAYSRKLALEQGTQRAIEKIMQTTADDTVENTLANEVVCQVNGTNADGTCKPSDTLKVTVTFRQECTDGSGTITTQTTTTVSDFDAYTCAAGSTEARYIEVKAQDQYKPMFSTHFTAFNSSEGAYDLSATAGMRTK